MKQVGAERGSRTKTERVEKHGNVLGLPSETYKAVSGITIDMFGLMHRIIGTKISAGHLRDLEVLFEAREDLIAEPEFAKTCGTDETLRHFRGIQAVGQLEAFFEEFTHLTGQLFNQIFEAQPDAEMVRLYHMIKGQFGTGYFVEKVERVIAFSYLKDMVADCVRQHPEYFAIHNRDRVEAVPNRIGYLFASISLHALRQRNSVVPG